MIKSLYQRPSNEKVIEIEIGQSTKLLTLTLIYNNKGELIYEMYGKQLRKENDSNVQILKNIEQIQYLEWRGIFSGSKKKIGEWKAFWKNRQLLVIVNYNNNGLKEGFCQEIFSNFKEENQLFESVIYKDGLRVGKWMTNKLIWIGSSLCGKQLMQDQIKQIEMKECIMTKDKRFDNGLNCIRNILKFLLIYEGSYIDNVKNGTWSTKFKYFSENFYRTMQLTSSICRGGGTYVNGLKNGNWIDTCQYFNKKLLDFLYQFKSLVMNYFFNLFLEHQKQLQSTLEFLGVWTIKNYGSNLLELHFPNMIYDENGRKQGIWMEIFKYQIHSVCDFLWCCEDVMWMMRGMKNEISSFTEIRNDKKVKSMFNQLEEVVDIIMERKQENGRNLNYKTISQQFVIIQILENRKREYKDGKKYGLWESCSLDQQYRQRWKTNTSTFTKAELVPITVFGIFNENGKEEGCWMYYKETGIYDIYNNFDRSTLQRVEFINGIQKTV